MIRIAGSLICGVIGLAIAWRASTPHAAFGWAVAACGWISDATHQLRSWLHLRKASAALAPTPAAEMVCGNCPEHKTTDHHARFVGSKVVWICYGDDERGLACPCPGFKPEPRR